MESLRKDIPERKRAEKALQESEEKYRLIAENMVDVITIVDMNLRFTYVSPSIIRIRGFTVEEAMAQTLEQAVTPESLQILLRAFEEEMQLEASGTADPDRTRIMELEEYRKDGSTFWMENTFSFIRDRDQKPTGILTLSRDISERKRAEEEKARLEALLQQSQKMEAIGTLAGGIAHDFNNILTAIMGYTELAISDFPQGSDTRDNLDEVVKASGRAKGLVEQILMFSRQSENKVLLIQLHLIIKEAIKLLRSSLPATIEIKQNIQASGKVLADPTQMHQIMMNLCTNASQAMFENGGELSVSLIQVNMPNDKSAPENLPPGLYLKLTVSDTGCGMAPDVINRIFEPYFTTKEHDKGTGLGLSMVHGIVHSHGGLITVESTLGKGSSFHVYLPEVTVSDEAKETITAEEPVCTGTERILVVDDEQAIVKMVKKILERLGYEVVGRTSSVEALELFREKPDQFDLVITDMTMPHMTGDQLSRKLIEIRPDIPIILCSGFSEKLTAAAAREIGIREFLMKPISRQVLSKMIRNVLDGVLGSGQANT